MERAGERIEGRFKDQPRVEATLRCTLAGIYLQLTMYETAERHARRAVELLDALPGEQTRLHRMDALNQLACALYYQKKYEEAESLISEALEGRNRIDADDPTSALRIWQNTATLYLKFGRMLQAEQIWRDVIRISREHADRGLASAAPIWQQNTSAMVATARPKTCFARRLTA